MIDRKQVIISGQEDILVSRPSSMPYIEAAEEVFESSFQAFEIANATTLYGEIRKMELQLSKLSLTGSNQSLENLLNMSQKYEEVWFGI